MKNLEKCHLRRLIFLNWLKCASSLRKWSAFYRHYFNSTWNLLERRLLVCLKMMALSKTFFFSGALYSFFFILWILIKQIKEFFKKVFYSNAWWKNEQKKHVHPTANSQLIMILWLWNGKKLIWMCETILNVFNVRGSTFLPFFFEIFVIDPGVKNSSA